MTTSEIISEPSYPGSAIALLTAICTAGVVATQPLQLGIVGIEGIGVFVVLASSVVRRYGHRLAGVVLLFVGSAISCLAVGLGVVYPAALLDRGVFVAGLLGPLAVLVGLYPLYARWARPLTGIGIALLVGALVLRGWLDQLGWEALLIGVLLTILTWDAAEHAITLGSEVGRDASTRAVSVRHTTGTLVVGVPAALVAAGFASMSSIAVPTSVLIGLLSAVLVLLFGLYLSYLE